MTLTADSGFEVPAEWQERRAPALETRRSWASAQPFVPRRTPFNDPESNRTQWSQELGTYRVWALVMDASAAALIGAALMVPLYGAGPETLALIAGVTLGFVAVVAMCRGYDGRTLGYATMESQSMLRAGALSVGLLMAVGFITTLDIPRPLVLVGVPCVVVSTIFLRFVRRKVLHLRRGTGAAMIPTMVIGRPEDVAPVAKDLSHAPHHGYSVVGVCVPSVDDAALDLDIPILGAIADVAQVVADRAIDTVVIAGNPLGRDALRRLSWALDRAGAQLIVAPDLVDVGAPRLTLRPLGDVTLLTVEVAAPRHRMLAKAVFDRVVGTLGLIVTAPIILAAALAVRLTSPGPAFFRQVRVGVDGEPFVMWKLRSMVVDAEDSLAELRDASDGNGVLFKMRSDPRVTPVGRILRALSIDELPQLLNVVLGDMSLVGPRPPLLEEVAQYPDSVQRRLRVKPGLTGLWQISGRSDLSWEESVRLDLRYVDNWSLSMDLTILWKTVRAVVRSDGAY